MTETTIDALLLRYLNPDFLDAGLKAEASAPDMTALMPEPALSVRLTLELQRGDLLRRSCVIGGHAACGRPPVQRPNGAYDYRPQAGWQTGFHRGARCVVRCKWHRELDYRLIKEVWATHGPRIAVRFAYEWHDDSGHWFRSYGNENWEFDDQGLMDLRHASINDLPIASGDRKFHWPPDRRPDDHPGLSDLGL
jgi:uncharacterized protein